MKLYTIGYTESVFTNDDLFEWSPMNNDELYDESGYTNFYSPIPEVDFDSYHEETSFPDDDPIHFYGGDYEPMWATHYYAKNVKVSGTNSTMTLNAQTQLKLMTGGRAGVGRQNLFCISASGTSYGKPPFTDLDYPWLETTPTSIPYWQLQALGQNIKEPDGKLWIAEADNAAIDLKLSAQAFNHYNATATVQQKYKLVHQTFNQALTDKNRDRTNIGVGEQVTLATQPPMPVGYNPYWSASAGGVSDEVGSSQTFTAPSNAATASISFEFADVKIPNAFAFKVLEPAGVDHAVITKTNGVDFAPPLSSGEAGAQMQLNVYIAPTYVSFYNVQIMEVGEDATNVTGYFTNNPPFTTSVLHHNTADFFFGLNADNSWNEGDHCWEGPEQDPPPAWASGSYTWVIPAKWSLSPSTVTNSMTGWNQVFTNDSSGTETITKFGKWVQRTTNNVITTSSP